MINGDDTIINHERIKEPAAELGRPMTTLTVLSRDPFTAATPARKAGTSVAPRNTPYSWAVPWFESYADQAELIRCCCDTGASGEPSPCRLALAASIRESTSPGVRCSRGRSSAFGRRSRDRSRIISTPYLEKLVCLEYNVARTVARKGGGKPADRKSDCPGVSTCLRGRCYVPLGDSR